VTPRKGSLVRIAIGGRYLDEVQIRLDLPDSLSHLSFPANRHRGRVEEDRVTVFTQGPTGVKLFADGVLPPIGGGAVTVAIGGREFGPCHLEAVETARPDPSSTGSSCASAGLWRPEATSDRMRQCHRPARPRDRLSGGPRTAYSQPDQLWGRGPAQSPARSNAAMKLRFGRWAARRRSR
jgi:hypothetical protein